MVKQEVYKCKENDNVEGVQGDILKTINIISYKDDFNEIFNDENYKLGSHAHFVYVKISDNVCM